jgi:exodeoxyribonuclease VII small subunit
MDKAPGYTDALQRLEAIVAELERGGADLETTVNMFEEGTALLRVCQNHLEDAEGRVRRLRLDEAEAEVEGSDDA